MNKKSALDLFFEVSLRHLYTAEHEVYDNLAVLARTASFNSLRSAFLQHREETELQISRIEHAFQILDIDFHTSKVRGMPTLRDQSREIIKTLVDFNFTDKSKGMIGIINEGKELIRHFGQTDAGDLALIAAGRKVEYFEIACYQSICLLADIYNEKPILDLMKASLAEEIGMQERLLHVAQEEVGSHLIHGELMSYS